MLSHSLIIVLFIVSIRVRSDIFLSILRIRPSTTSTYKIAPQPAPDKTASPSHPMSWYLLGPIIAITRIIPHSLFLLWPTLQRDTSISYKCGDVANITQNIQGFDRRRLHHQIQRAEAQQKDQVHHLQAHRWLQRDCDWGGQRGGWMGYLPWEAHQCPEQDQDCGFLPFLQAIFVASFQHWRRELRLGYELQSVCWYTHRERLAKAQDMPSTTSSTSWLPEMVSGMFSRPGCSKSQF